MVFAPRSRSLVKGIAGICIHIYMYIQEGSYIYIYIYTTIRELGPKMPYYRRNYGSQFTNGCIRGPAGYMQVKGLGLRKVYMYMHANICKGLGLSIGK